VSAHAEFLRAATNDTALATQVKSNFRHADLSEKDSRMLEFVEKLTRHPWMVDDSDIQILRQSGFLDVEILHIVLGSAHFNYLNRVADGIGIRFEYQSNLPEFRPQTNEKQDLSKKGRQETSALQRQNAIAWIQCPDENGPKSLGSDPVNLFRVMGENLEASILSKEWRSYHLRPTRALNAQTRGRLALYISGINYCDYSIFWFRRFLMGLENERSILDSLSQGKQPAALGELEKLQYEHAERLTLEPWTTREYHLKELQGAGMDELGILQLTMLISYLSFETRVVLGLGVAIEKGSL
jgi:alkylhydroperoxidase family enzyme